MSRKNLLKDFPSILAGDMSQVSIVGIATSIAQFDLASYTFSWTGGAATNGNIGIEYSLDNVVWHSLDFKTTIPTDTASGSHQLLITEITFPYARPRYDQVNGASTGTLKVELSCSTKGA